MLTDESPRIAGLVDHRRGRVNVRGIAKKWKPHVFYVKVIEGLEAAVRVGVSKARTYTHLVD